MDDDPLSDWGLRPVELADQPTIMPFFQCLAEPLSDYTFSQLFTWRNSLRILWTTLHGHLCVFANGSGDLTLLMPPIGAGGAAADHALRDSFGLMDDYNTGHGVPHRSRVEYASQELIDRIQHQGMILQPMGADYLYDVNRMIDLAGGDLSSKRQAKNRFIRNYRFRVETYEAAVHLNDCRRLLDSWKIHQDANHLEEPNISAIKRQKESIATDLTLQYAQQLGMKGMVVYAGDINSPQEAMSLRAFTFGELLGQSQSSITIEKTELEVKGLAQFIFSEFSRVWADRPLVNVGDDWGLETLAWTKMSYRPVKMLQKFVLRQSPVAKVAVPVEIKAIPKPQEKHAYAAKQIRQATKDDLSSIVALEKECFSAYCLSRRQLQYLQQRETVVFLVAGVCRDESVDELEPDPGICGEGIALVRQHKRGFSGRIYSLAVDPISRGRGIGLLLLDAMIRELASRGVKRVYLEVEQTNAAAIRLYERSGFSSIGILPDYYSAGKPAVHMMREIGAAPGLFDAAREPIADSEMPATQSGAVSSS